MQPSYKLTGRYVTWSRLGKDQEFSVTVRADGKVELDQIEFNDETNAYFDRPTIEGEKAISFANEHIGADFMEIARKEM